MRVKVTDILEMALVAEDPVQTASGTMLRVEAVISDEHSDSTSRLPFLVPPVVWDVIGQGIPLDADRLDEWPDGGGGTIKVMLETSRLGSVAKAHRTVNRDDAEKRVVEALAGPPVPAPPGPPAPEPEPEPEPEPAKPSASRNGVTEPWF